MISPYAATYAASKAFVSSITHSLGLELEDDHIRTTDILAGRTDTEFDEQRLGMGSRAGNNLPTMQPEQVADAIVRVVQHPQRSVTLRLFDRLVIWGNILVPGFLGRKAKQQYE
jgi:short-subunit dehydrogenase